MSWKICCIVYFSITPRIRIKMIQIPKTEFYHNMDWLFNLFRWMSIICYRNFYFLQSFKSRVFLTPSLRVSLQKMIFFRGPLLFIMISLIACSREESRTPKYDVMPAWDCLQRPDDPGCLGSKPVCVHSAWVTYNPVCGLIFKVTLLHVSAHKLGM